MVGHRINIIFILKNLLKCSISSVHYNISLLSCFFRFYHISFYLTFLDLFSSAVRAQNISNTCICAVIAQCALNKWINSVLFDCQIWLTKLHINSNIPQIQQSRHYQPERAEGTWGKVCLSHERSMGMAPGHSLLASLCSQTEETKNMHEIVCIKSL